MDDNAFLLYDATSTNSRAMVSRRTRWGLSDIETRPAEVAAIVGSVAKLDYLTAPILAIDGGHANVKLLE